MTKRKQNAIIVSAPTKATWEEIDGERLLVLPLMKGWSAAITVAAFEEMRTLASPAKEPRDG